MSLAGIAFGLASSISFGSGDFIGGLASRTSRGAVVAAGSQLVGAVLLLVLLLVVRPPLPGAGDLLLGVAAGALGGLGVAALYQGLAMGSMGLVAAISALGSILLPLGVDLVVYGAALGPLQVVGVLLAAAAAAAAGGSVREGVSSRALLLGAGAALAFGSWFVLLDLATAQDPTWGLVSSRTGGTLTLALVVALTAGGSAGPERGGVFRGLRRTWPLILVSGTLDVGGNALYVLSLIDLPVGVAASLAGVYPLVTMLLARLVLGERLPPLGLLGVTLAVAGIVLISIGPI
jgi:drug/metabolite transporter (DMT)-like permease